MKKLFFTMIGLMVFTTVFGQHIDEYLLDKEEALLHHQRQQKEGDQQTALLPPQEKTILGDLDEDGMDDDWETMNGLNPMDPTDAWEDADSDFILNLFEFQLQTSPNNDASPAVIEFNPDTDDLPTLMSLAEGGLAVIRIPEGVYPINFIKFYTGSVRLMLQGGWNTDFTEYNPELYPVVLDGGFLDEVLYFATSSTITPFANMDIILEGLDVINGGGFSLFGSITFLNDEGVNAALSVYNCKVYGGTANGIVPVHREPGESTQVFIAKTLIVQNGVDAMYSQTTDGASAKLKIVNCTFSDNDEEGLDAFTNDATSNLVIDFINTINWGNTDISFDLNDNITLNISYSDYDFLDANPFVVVNESNTISTDPLFEDPLALNYRLSTGSPCIDAGTVVGFDFAGTAPEMGVYETSCISSEDITILLGGPDAIITTEESITLEIQEEFPSIIWSDGTAGSTLTIVGSEYGVGVYEIIVNIVDAGGCNGTATITITVEEVNSTDELGNTIQLGITPNPVSIGGEFLIQLPASLSSKDATIRIFNAQGQQIFFLQDLTGEQYRIPALQQSGVYWVQMRMGDDWIGMEKVVVVE
jgi:hypothetical protein